MTIYVTASGNFDNKKSWSGLKKHLQHDEAVHHKNKYLELDQSKLDRKFNKHLVLESFDDFTEKMFSPYVKKHDEKEERESRKYKTVKRFITVDSRGRKRKTNMDLNYVEKFSDEKTWHLYLKALEKNIKKKYSSRSFSDEQVHAFAMKAVSDGLADWAKDFNKRNPNLKLFESYIHMDEKGAPHVHSRVLPIVYKRDKKPSTSLNTALAKQYNLPRNGKLLLSKFRKQEDTALINSVDKSVERELHLKSNFELLRKSDKDKNIVTGVSHDEYVHNQEILDKQNKQIEENKAVLSKQNNEITIATSTLNLTNKKVENARKAQKQAEEAKESTIKATTHEALKSAQNAQESYLKSLDDYKQELDERDKKQKQKEKELAERAKQLESREQFMKNVEKAFFSGFYSNAVETDADLQRAKDIFNEHKHDADFKSYSRKNFVRGVSSSTDYLTNTDTLNIMFESRDQQKYKQKQQNNDLNL